jgi:hypothetical protein
VIKSWSNQLPQTIALLALLGLSACSGGGGGGGGGSVTSLTAPPGGAASTLTTQAGGVVGVTDPNSPIFHAQVVIAPATLETATEDIVISYKDALPASFNANAVAMGAIQASKTLVLSRTGTKTLPSPAEVTIPYDKTVVSDNEIPLVIYWNEANATYSPVAIKSIDRTAGTITFFTAHFSSYIVITLKGIGDIINSTIPTVETGFRPEIDGFFIKNIGSYSFPDGSCFGMANYAAWYYSYKKGSTGAGLFSLYRDGQANWPQDDQNARELVTRAFVLSNEASMNGVWASLSGTLNNLQDLTHSQTLTGATLIAAMSFDKKPQTLLMFAPKVGENPYSHGHAVTVYRYDSVNLQFELYDNNYPNKVMKLPWNVTGGFGSYSTTNGVGGNYTVFHLDALHSSTTPSEFEGLFQEATNGWANSVRKFVPIHIMQPKVSPNSPDSAGNDVYSVSKDGNITFSANVLRNVGESAKPRWAHIFYAGQANAETIVPVSDAGDFTFTLTKLPKAGKNSVIILVAQSATDWTTGFSAFDQFTVNNSSLTITPQSPSITVGSTVQLTANDAQGNPSTIPNLQWAFSNGSVATVGSTGLVTGVAVGTTNITVTDPVTQVSASTTVTISSQTCSGGGNYVTQGGLTWTPNNCGQGATYATQYPNDHYFTWPEANAYCTGMGMRLPTQDELSAFFWSKAMAGQGWTLGNTWSSTPDSAGYLVVPSMWDGYITTYNNEGPYYVTCVR